MPSPPRLLFPGQLVFITSRTETGLPFVCTKYMRLIIESALARAQHLYPVTICAFCMMGNHFHMLAVVEDREILSAFIGRIKTELSHAINRLLGRRRRTVWCDDFDSEPILTLEDAIEKFIYLYTNPQQARLEDSLEKYPGVTTWDVFLAGETTTTEAPWINRPFIKPLDNPSLTYEEDLALTAEISAKSKESHTLTISPSAWFTCFKVPEADADKIRHCIVDGVRVLEKTLEPVPCIGAERLKAQPIDMPYTPQKFSRRMWCICRDLTLRSEFIKMVKNLIAKGRSVYERWKKGDYSVPYPQELFAPRMPRKTQPATR